MHFKSTWKPWKRPATIILIITKSHHCDHHPDIGILMTLSRRFSSAVRVLGFHTNVMLGHSFTHSVIITWYTRNLYSFRWDCKNVGSVTVQIILRDIQRHSIKMSSRYLVRKIVSTFDIFGCFGARRVNALCLNHRVPHLQLTITQSGFIGSATFHTSCFKVSPAYIQDPMSNFNYQCLTSDIWLQIFNFRDLNKPIEIRSLLL